MTKGKRYTKITKKRLDECLALIGWSTRHGGCDFYWICNQYGKNTDFRFSSKKENERIYKISFEGQFGDGHKFTTGGDCCFMIGSCDLRVFLGADGEPDCVSIGVPKAKGKKETPAFLQFYNHGKS